MKSFKTYINESSALSDVKSHVDATRRVIAGGTVYIDHAMEKAGVPKHLHDVVRHGIAHGTNTLGFRDKMNALKESAGADRP